MNKEQVDEIVKNHHIIKQHQMMWIGLRKSKCKVEFKRHIDHSISTTTNVPNDATEELIAQIYEAGWRKWL